MRKFTTNSREETIELGEKIVKALPKDVKVILLDGNLSAGKTTITKGIAKALGVKGIVNSPTFTILKTYPGDVTLYHLDLYRLNEVGNDFDLEDYINDEDGFTVIEWPYQVNQLLPDRYVELKLTFINEDTREIEVHSHHINDEWEANI
ncbi:tRNA (adenosine(37)-N6)-threonylcarbamoyltransferase complex ATPase subunit type 1 TsaE [Acholeplasma hippikon]|nr:tRNA (adenosine(37)-N6)-threonylcarbamoyltransferase complex ATPase subunit type 1 TsaE [Acholeplasma hippikon]